MRPLSFRASASSYSNAELGDVMGKPAFTPGPWEIDRDPRPDMEWNNHIVGADGMTVCFMSHDNTKENPTGESNAALIAAAPDMYEALKKSAEGWANAIELGIIPEQHRTSASILRDEARAALAKVQP